MPELAKAYVQIIPTMQGVKGSLGKLLDSAGDSAGHSSGNKFAAAFAKSTSSIGGIITKGLKGAGSIAVDGVVGLFKDTGMLIGGVIQAGAKGVTSMVTQSIQAFADNEQLKGGITTLFEDLDWDVFQNANKAFKTAGLSANEYMETAISFAASLNNSLQKSDGNIARSAELTDQIIVDMADNVNKMGTTMEAVQNAYRGFSRGNFTMLDNLALGFAGTKEGMQQLLDKAVEYEKEQGRVAKFSIDSFADIAEAIHIVQDNMGITGTTAAEAAGTISGSIGSMKAAWQNLLTGISDPSANVGKLTTQLASSVVTVARNMKPVVRNALRGIGEMVGELGPMIAEDLPGLINEFAPSLINTGVNLAVTLGTVLAENAPSIISTLCDALVTNAPALATGAVQLVVSLVTGIAQSLPQVIMAGAQVFGALLDAVVAGIPELLNAGANLVSGLWQGISGAAGWLWDKLMGWLSGIWEGIKEFFQVASPSKKMAWMGEMLSEGLANGITASTEDAVAAATAMSTDVLGAISAEGARLSMSATGTAEVIHRVEGKVQVEGVNNKGEMVAVMDMFYEDFVNRLRQEVRYA